MTETITPTRFTPPADEQIALNAQQACAFLGCGHLNIQQARNLLGYYRARGGLRAVRIGKSYVYTREALTAFLQSKQGASA